MQKKMIVSSAVLASGLLFSAASLAATPGGGQGGQGAQGSIGALMKEIQALALARQNNEARQHYQNSHMQQSAQQVNTVSIKDGDTDLSVPEYIRKQAANSTLQTLSKRLSQIPSAVVTLKNKAQIKAQRENSPAAQLKDATSNLKASDTLYAAGPKNVVAFMMAAPYGVAKPPVATVLANDRHFNVASVINPTAYTKAQQAAAQGYLGFLTKSAKSLTTGIDFSKLRSLSEKQKPKALADLKNSTAYQNYQYDVRSSAARRSVVLNTFDRLMAERTPVKGLGKSLGFTKGASPLQLEKYRATHRVTDPKWYKAVQNSSPATVQRETLLVLAEIEAQNYQRHLDQERTETELATLISTMSGNQDMLRKAQNRTLNTEIGNVVDSVTKSKKDDSSDSKATGNYTPSSKDKDKAKAEAKKRAEQKAKERK